MSYLEITATQEEWDELYEEEDSEWDLIKKGLATVAEPDFDNEEFKERFSNVKPNKSSEINYEEIDF